MQVKELQQGVRGASVAQVVGAIYKKDPRIKDFIKETLACTAIELMTRTPSRFAISRDKRVVLPADSGAVITMDEVAKHCTKEDGWIVVKGEVQPRPQPVADLSLGPVKRHDISVLRGSLAAEASRSTGEPCVPGRSWSPRGYEKWIQPL